MRERKLLRKVSVVYQKNVPEPTFTREREEEELPRDGLQLHIRQAGGAPQWSFGRLLA